MRYIVSFLVSGVVATLPTLYADHAGGLPVMLPPSQGQPNANPATTVAILVFPGVQIIDFTGPYEVFGQSRCTVVTVAEKAEPFTTAMGLKIVPTHTLANCPEAEVLVLPGGNVRPNPAISTWVRERAAKAKHVLSVCNGAFFLADAGLLDGLSATTFNGLIDELQKVAPQCKVVRDQRFVDNGKIVTTAGLSSGIDGALHVVEKMRGHGFAQEVALGIEYNWQPDSGYARANLAEVHLRKALGRGMTLPDGATSKVVRTQGGVDQWEKRWEMQQVGTPADVLKLLDGKLSAEWKRGDGSDTNRNWTFTDAQGRTWDATAEVTAGSAGQVTLTVRLKRS